MRVEELIERLNELGVRYFGKEPEYKRDLIVYDGQNAQNWWRVDGVWHHLTVVRYRFFVDGVEKPPDEEVVGTA